jgi:hypothetical protein
LQIEADDAQTAGFDVLNRRTKAGSPKRHSSNAIKATFLAVKSTGEYSKAHPAKQYRLQLPAKQNDYTFNE